ncbi:type VI secretion system ATPase TssH [Psychrobacter aestuarii]|uniref:Type VI secretion system ATPase TssH n=1 Tax=Psychrobacter aestuarii TaxID=556327 RepID=A0ABN0VU32_9GAMM|nr:type VI secretion system ATPase TssH [Psychrobacter aestuarii]
MSQLKAVITRLSPSCRQSLQQAAKHCIEMGHQEVDVLHLLYELVATPNNDVAAILNKNSINQPELLAMLQEQLEAWSVSPDSSVVFSSRLMALLQDAWQVASTQTNHSAQEAQVKSGHILLVILNFDDYQPLLAGLPEALRYIDAVMLKNDYDKICAQSTESASVAGESDAPVNKDSQQAFEPAATVDTTKSGNNDAQAALDQYTYNLTAQASAGKIDPVIGREFEIHQLIDILIRRRQNNPILTGEAGVGKTAVVEGLAQKIVAKDVPAQLQDVALHTLDLGLLQAGASVKGEFENRLKQVIEAVQSSPQPIILFIDEAHTLIGAGGAAGQNDAANLLKPALARGELRTIAATTWSEYKKYFEKDAALSRRFQVVQVKEPDTETAIAMIRGLSAKMQQHFDIIIEDDALRAAVELSARYISERQLPDKAVSVLDTAAARVSLSKTSIPNAIDKRLATDKHLTLHIQHLDDQLKRVGSTELQEKLSQKIAALDEERQENKKVTDAMTAAWQTQQTLNQQLDTLSAELRGELSSSERLDKQAEYQSIEQALVEAQDAYHLVHAVLNEVVIKQVISDWTGIPLNDMAGDEKERVLKLAPILQQQVIGQDHALDAIVKRIHTAKARLDDPSRPQGIFLLVGPSGVGKTQTAHTLAEVLYGGAQNLITINLSEYQEAHSVASLKGSPPGYVGYGEGGVLTEAVRRRPYSVLLLDEVEKAHPDVLDLFYQVFDKGVMEDSEGRVIDFKNTLILLTSNVGSSTIMQACLNTTGDSEHVLPDSEALKQLINPQLYKDFKPAFLGRLTTIPFYPLTDDALATIIDIKLNKIVARIHTNYGVECQIDPEVIEVILSRCHEVDSGARNADAIINHTLLPQLASQLLAHDDTKGTLERITISVDEADGFVYELITTPVVPLSQMAQSSAQADSSATESEEALS